MVTGESMRPSLRLERCEVSALDQRDQQSLQGGSVRSTFAPRPRSVVDTTPSLSGGRRRVASPATALSEKTTKDGAFLDLAVATATCGKRTAAEKRRNQAKTLP
jgi:hypothetical protein